MGWSSLKQSSVTLSTIEAEYVALTHAVRSLTWFELFCGNLGIMAIGKPSLLGNNVSSHFLIRNASHHRRLKHIDVYYHLIHKWHENGKFTLQFVSGKDNLAYILTKALSPEQVSYFSSLIFS